MKVKTRRHPEVGSILNSGPLFNKDGVQFRANMSSGLIIGLEGLESFIEDQLPDNIPLEALRLKTTVAPEDEDAHEDSIKDFLGIVSPSKAFISPGPLLQWQYSTWQTKLDNGLVIYSRKPPMVLVKKKFFSREIYYVVVFEEDRIQYG